MDGITRFDPSEHLDDAEIQAELLDEALATGNPRVIVHAIGTIARARGMTSLARDTGIARGTLYKAIADDGNPTLETLMTVLAALQIDLSAKVAAR